MIAAVALVGTCLTIVDETEAVVVERFGRIVAVYDQPEQRGLHFKLPWPVDVARRFDRRVQLFEPPGREVFTRDKKNITVDAYLCWRIAGNAERPAGGDPEDLLLERPVIRFYRGVGSTDVAEARLDTRIRSALSTALGRVDLAELLQVAGEDEEGQPKDGNRPASPLARIAELVHADILAGREGDASLPEKLGIEIVDVRIRRLGFPSGNQSAVFERMRSERRKIAETYRSAGMAENRMIMSRADRHSNEVLARARADAERIRGEAEAESIRILNEAHAKDPELYQTLRTLDAYKAMLTEKTTLVLSASSELLKLLTGGIPDSIGDRPPAPKSTRAEERPSGDGR
ncbi:MAG: protease modulator HflC [Planctomycetaceae bacterium]|nr:protease modulator HflC [Planctomycetaceae bacterium]